MDKINYEPFKVIFEKVKINDSYRFKIVDIQSLPSEEYKLFFNSNKRYPIIHNEQTIHMNSRTSYSTSNENLILSEDEVNKIIIAVTVLNLQYKIWKKISIVSDYLLKDGCDGCKS